jgi:two-component system response regulator YesN
MYEKDQQYLILFSFRDRISENDIQRLLYEILDRIAIIMTTYIDSQVTFGISTRGNHYSELKRLYDEAVSALKQSYFIGTARFIRYADSSNKSVYLSLVEKFRDRIAAFGELNSEYRNEIMAGIVLLEDMFSAPEDKVCELFIRWIHWPVTNLSVLRNNTPNLALEYDGRVRNCSTLPDTMEVFEQYLLAIVKAQVHVKLASREVTEAVKYIKGNYDKDISLQQVAGQVEISANYLCSLFKKELQISFIDYTNQIRIDKAKELLISTHLKTYEIARKVGFADESYFSRIFKRITGLRPYEFKKQNLVGVEELLEK